MHNISEALKDLIQSLKSYPLWTLLGWLQIRQRYSRSKIGPFWLTISMGILVATMGIVYGALFGQNLKDYLPMISISIVLWGLFSGIINEGCSAYIESANYIRQIHTPIQIYVLQVVWRNIIIFIHNFVIVLIVFLIFGLKDWATLPYFIPGLILFLLNAIWIALVISVVAARFRDFPQVISALMQVAFYVTPILFQGNMLGKDHYWIVEYNPLAYLVDVARQPLLGEVPEPHTWIIALAMVSLGWFLALIITGRYCRKVSLWV